MWQTQLRDYQINLTSYKNVISKTGMSSAVKDAWDKKERENESLYKLNHKSQYHSGSLLPTISSTHKSAATNTQVDCRVWSCHLRNQVWAAGCQGRRHNLQVWNHWHLYHYL